MKKFPLVAAVAAIGLSSQAFAYSTTANVTFSWATDGKAIGWTASAANTLANVNNSTYFTQQTGFNSTTYYNADFWNGSLLCPVPAYVAQYACKLNNNIQPVADIGPGASATGTLSVTDTALTGVLTVINTNDEGAGPQPGTSAASGYNVRSADGSPFKNVWYGVSSNATLTVNLTGSFSATNWDITGGTVAFADPNFQCAVADFSGVLCSPSTTTGGFTTNASFLSWGIDLKGAGIGEIGVYDALGTSLISTLSGVLASLTLDGAGNITTTAGEFRNGSSQGACNTQVRYAAGAVTCGTIQVGLLNITGQAATAVIPVPAAVWLFGSALGLLGVARRKLAA